MTAALVFMTICSTSLASAQKCCSGPCTWYRRNEDKLSRSRQVFVCRMQASQTLSHIDIDCRPPSFAMS